MLAAEFGQARQTDGYEVRTDSDLWYNSVDGIRIGLNMQGRVAGAGHHGPHRLDTGVWLGLWFPSLPVSYRIAYTEPFPFWSEAENEFHLRLVSSIREGYQRHGGELRKRWQAGLEFRNFIELVSGFHLERRFDDNYVLFRELWSDRWKGLWSGELEWQRLNRAGMFSFQVRTLYNILEDPFQVSSATLVQQVRLSGGWEVRGRLFGSIIDEAAYPEYHVFAGFGAQKGTLSSQLFRSRGTLPPAWVRGGHLHHASGPNLRGYTHSDMRSIREGIPMTYSRIGAVNLELDIPNPVQSALRQSDMAGEFLSFRTYLFSGAGLTDGSDNSDRDELIGEAGMGIATGLNIPGISGRFRGFVLRYESPLWLSYPDSGGQWRWRHLVGFGAVITF